MRSLKTLSLMLLLVLPAAVSAATVPVKAIFRLTLDTPPGQDGFVSYLEFLNYQQDAVLVKLEFKHKKNRVYEAVLNAKVPDELNKLVKMCEEDNRGYWDEMWFSNREENARLAIKHIFFKVIYNSGTKGCLNDITILDWDVDRVFEQSYSKIPLNSYARFSRLKWVKAAVKKITGKDYDYDANTCPALLEAIRDIGKCGTEGSSWVDMNPKYGAGADNLCSEFVSWYYHNAGTPFGRSIFKDLVGSIPFINLFSSAGRAYEYNNLTRRFEHFQTGAPYEPQPGDYLRRINSGHSMMLAGWNSETKTAAVINGPWPVTIRKVEVQKEEDTSEKEYQIGRVEDSAGEGKYPH